MATRRSFFSLFFATYFLGLLPVGILAQTPGHQQACGTWTAPTQGSGIGISGTNTFYPTIQAAHDAASPGATLVVENTTHTEGPVKITKNITLSGAGPNLPRTVLAAVDTCSTGEARGWFTVGPGVELTVKYLTFDGNGKKIYEGFRHQGSGSFSDCTFHDIQYQADGPDYQGTAVAAFGGNVNFSGVSFTDIGRTGVLYFGNGITGSAFQGTYTGKGSGNHLDYGLDIDKGAHVTVTDSTFEDCQGTAEGSSSAGVQISTFAGPGTTVTLTNNTIEHNSIGIAAGRKHGNNPDTSNVTAHGNTITGNTSGLQAVTDQTIPASGNNWGCPQGPGHPGCDPITGPNASKVELGASGVARTQVVTSTWGNTQLAAGKGSLLYLLADSGKVWTLDPSTEAVTDLAAGYSSVQEAERHATAGLSNSKAMCATNSEVYVLQGGGVYEVGGELGFGNSAGNLVCLKGAAYYANSPSQARTYGHWSFFEVTSGGEAVADVGQPNDPIGLMTGLGSTFYFVRDSELHSIEINSGNQASRVGTDSWDNVTAMTGASGRLFLVDGSTLYSVAASGGARTKIGTDSWSGVTAMALVGSDLYLVDGTTVWKVTP